jgi:N-methylhydantoinase A
VRRVAATRIGIDTGGTFTDVVRLSGRRATVHKLRSTPADPSQAVLDGLAAVRKTPGEVVDVVHGTTVGLNAMLTGRLARTVFVTNRGLEDLIEVGRQERTDLYALAPSRPVPPVPRALRVGVACRRDAAGDVVEALSEREVERVVAAVRHLRPAAVAIGLLHAPRDARDEQRLLRALRRALPDVPMTASAELAPVFGEYERFTAAIVNATISPVVGRYTARLEEGVGAGSLRLLRSSLGIMPADEARRFPARAMFSGPAGGVLATGQIARHLGHAHAAAFDMGGTSADVCLIERRSVVTATSAIAGLPLPLPAVPVHTVGCGGGSIAYADAGGALRVGPESAGADPGPACYGRGNEPTVTDAHVALGHLGERTLLAGAFPIDVDASVRAIERLARRLGLGTAATARGILTVADATMARAVLQVTAERAIDPATVPLVAYGGAGGLHAAGLVLRLGMPFAIVPPAPGAFSALGLALAGEAVERAEAVLVPLAGDGGRALRGLIARGTTLLAEAVDALARGAGGGRSRGRVEALVRYRGQGAALRLPLDTNLVRHFARAHQRHYGFTTEAELEVVQVLARAERPTRPMPAFARGTETAPPARRRPPVGGRTMPVLHRATLRSTVRGPAIIEEATATTLVPPGCTAEDSPLGLRVRPSR